MSMTPDAERDARSLVTLTEGGARCQCIAPDVRLGENIRLAAFVNLYGCRVGDDTRIGTFVEIQKGAEIGVRCKISSHTFICEGVTVEDEVFIGHGVLFINDRDPRATTPDGQPATEADWELQPTRDCRGASIGSGAVLLGGITIGAGALIGAGAVVTADVPAWAVVVGNPARFLRWRDEAGGRSDDAVASGPAGWEEVKL
jgi:acetyltransferase-like isoleucine patch superfamily enzyme